MSRKPGVDLCSFSDAQQQQHEADAEQQVPDAADAGDRCVQPAGQRQAQRLRDAPNHQGRAGDVQPHVVERERTPGLFTGKVLPIF